MENPNDSSEEEDYHSCELPNFELKFFVGPPPGEFARLRWLETVSSTYILMGRYNDSLSLDTTIMVSKICPVIDQHVVSIFVTQQVTIATVLLAKNTLNYSFRAL